MTNQNDANKGPIHDNANQESHGKHERFVSELIHEFTHAVKAVIGYSELALHEIERSHPARAWLEKIKITQPPPAYSIKTAISTFSRSTPRQVPKTFSSKSL